MAETLFPRDAWLANSGVGAGFARDLRGRVQERRSRRVARGTAHLDAGGADGEGVGGAGALARAAWAAVDAGGVDVRSGPVKTGPPLPDASASPTRRCRTLPSSDAVPRTTGCSERRACAADLSDRAAGSRQRLPAAGGRLRVRRRRPRVPRPLALQRGSDVAAGDRRMRREPVPGGGARDRRGVRSGRHLRLPGRAPSASARAPRGGGCAGRSSADPLCPDRLPLYGGTCDSNALVCFYGGCVAYAARCCGGSWVLAPYQCADVP